MEKTCPRCGLLNQGAAMRCDCGYDFTSSTPEHHPDLAPDYPSPEDTKAKRRTAVFLRRITVACGLPLLIYPFAFIASLMCLIDERPPHTWHDWVAHYFYVTSLLYPIPYLLSIALARISYSFGRRSLASGLALIAPVCLALVLSLFLAFICRW